MKTGSMFEILFEEYLKERAVDFEKEYCFNKPESNHRFDFAIPLKKIAIEIEGGIYKKEKGRHTNPEGYCNDCFKYNIAARLGWKLYRIPSPWFTKKHYHKIEEILSWIS